MKKFGVTTALALVLAGGAYAQGHHGGGGGGGGGGMGGGGGDVAAHGGGGGGPGFSGGARFSGGGGAGPSFSAQRGPSGPSMGNRGPTAGVYNRAPTTNAYNGGNHSRFTERNQRELYNRYEGENHNRFENREGNRVDNGIRVGKGNLGNFRHGIASGNFFEHGRHFGFRRFCNDQWVFLTAWDSCTAWAWVNVAPGAWAWTPIDICIG